MANDTGVRTQLEVERLRARLTNAEVAAKLKVDDATVRRIQRRQAALTPKYARGYASLFKVSTDQVARWYAQILTEEEWLAARAAMAMERAVASGKESAIVSARRRWTRREHVNALQIQTRARKKQAREADNADSL